MNKYTIIKLEDLVQKVEYARGTPEFEKWTNTLLTFLDGYITGWKEE